MTPATARARRQRVPGHVHIVEWQYPAADLLVLLVPLAGDEHEIARSRLLHRPLDRGLTIDQRHKRRRLRPRRPLGATRSAGITMPRLISSMICVRILASAGCPT